MTNQTTLFAPSSYVSPACKTIELSPEAHYLEASSNYGENGRAGAFSSKDIHNYGDL